MFCKNCGKEIDNNAVACQYCGTHVQGGSLNHPSVDDNGSIGWCVLGCLIPIVGLILYLVWKDTKPLTAKQAGKGALIAAILWAIGTVLYIILIAFGLAVMSTEMYY